MWRVVHEAILEERSFISNQPVRRGLTAAAGKAQREVRVLVLLTSGRCVRHELVARSANRPLHVRTFIAHQPRGLYRVEQPKPVDYGWLQLSRSDRVGRIHSVKGEAGHLGPGARHSA
eukprot:scaffold11721_cov63-Phaeocystis_antarctica.AAC.3